MRGFLLKKTTVDTLYFLRQRLRFIRRFYGNASFPFTEQKRKIEVGEDPFIPSYNYEYEEPPFLDEWIEAEESLDVLGQACISMLANSLHLYLEECVKELGVGCPDKAAKKGWINGYRVFFEEKLRICWKAGPTTPEFLDEIALTRNRAQHPEHIDMLGIAQSKHDFAKHRRPFFADEAEMQAMENSELPEEEWLFGPWCLKITKDKLLAAIDQVEHFSIWFEDQYRSRQADSTSIE